LPEPFSDIAFFQRERKNAISDPQLPSTAGVLPEPVIANVLIRLRISLDNRLGSS
jgi:hypothetical protein